MARTEYKTIVIGKKEIRSTIQWSPPVGVCLSSHYLTQGVGGLSLSPLVTDPAASRPPGEREEVHRFSV